jgi:hypothetical protein
MSRAQITCFGQSCVHAKWIFECRDGRIARVREYMDTLGGYNQLFEKGHPLQSQTAA